MPSWKKIVVSGSSPELSDVQISTFGAAAGAYGTVSDLSSSLAQRVSSAEGGGVTGVVGDSVISASRSGNTVTLKRGNTFASSVTGSFRGELISGSVKFVGGGVSGSAASTGSFGRLEVIGNGNIDGNLTLGGNITIGDGNTDNIAIGGEFTSNLVPDSNNTFDLGTSAKSWNRLMINEITASGNISGSSTSTGSFGNVFVAEMSIPSVSDMSSSMANRIDSVEAGSTTKTLISSSVEGDAQGQIKFNGVNVNSNALGTDDSPTFDGLNVSNNLTVGGNLDVNGTLTTIDSTNLTINDKFILIASGSTGTDTGIVANTTADGSGSAFYFDNTSNRWSITAAGETAGTQLSVTPKQFLVSVSQSAADPGTNPNDFGSDATSRRGMMHINTSTGDIFIWS